VEAHIKATEEVLEELGAQAHEKLIVFNKVDMMNSSQIMALKLRYQGAVFVSAASGAGLEELMTKMEALVSSKRKICTLKIPQEQFDIVNQIYRLGRVISVDYVENDVLVKAELKGEDYSRLSSFQTEDV
jgi:GTP-binding protein HflX